MHTWMIRTQLIPMIGPTKVAATNNAIAIPRSTGPHMSANAPAQIAKGPTPKNPPQNLQIMMVSTFCATATGIWKIAKPVNAMHRGVMRPKSSDNGPHTIGPTPNPSTKSEVPSVATSVLTPNSAEIDVVALLSTLDANVTTQVMEAIMLVFKTRRLVDQLCGFSGSRGPFHATTFGSCCGRDDPFDQFSAISMSFGTLTWTALVVEELCCPWVEAC